MSPTTLPVALNLPSSHFRHCPKCGHPQAPPQGQVFQCTACAFLLHFNPAVSAAVFLTRSDGGVLFIRRAHEPARGKLGIPGGFLDLLERAEEGLRREVREEVGVEMGVLTFVCSETNNYLYRDVTYPVVDLYFTAPLLHGQTPVARDGVEAWCWLKPDAVRRDELAFPSLHAAFDRFQSSHRLCP